MRICETHHEVYSITADLGISFGKDDTGESAKLYADADFGSDPSDRKSITGYVMLLHSNPVFWNTTKQKLTALSSGESEFVALSH